jgi:general secretion pathway protein K
MNICISKINQGFAVVIALVAVTLLSLLAGALAYAMKVETKLAANATNDEQLLWLARAGAERARWIRAMEATIPGQTFDSLNQIWAGGPGFGPETNSALAGVSLDNFPVGGGTVSLKIIDLERLININTADGPLIQQVLTSMNVDASQLSIVSDSILDWIDQDDATRPAGAESDYYQGLMPSYYAKNAPMDDISELLLVKGVTWAMFTGGTPDDQGSPFTHHHLGFGSAPGQTPQYAFGLTNVFTPFSSGQININTADETVLELIPGMDTTTAQNIQRLRGGPDNDDTTTGAPMFQNVGQLVAAGINPQGLAQISRYCATRSTTFEVIITATVGQHSRNYTAILFQNGPKVQIVGFYPE